MEKLMKPAEYAKELGISRQAVYAKIKRGILTAKNVDGKLYIVVDNEKSEETKVTETVKPKPKTKTSEKPANINHTNSKDYKALLDAKDETIAVLKGTVKDLKKSNKTDINNAAWRDRSFKRCVSRDAQSLRTST